MAFFYCPFLKVVLPFFLIFTVLVFADCDESVKGDVKPKEVKGDVSEAIGSTAVVTEPANSETQSPIEEIAGPKVAEIVKNPVNVDLNKLPSDVIDKIAEGGVTLPRMDTTSEVAEKDTSDTTDTTDTTGMTPDFTEVTVQTTTTLPST
ncbi:hypothetical protein RUM43_005659 [Polyplax serrata]|uniref:Uncharacterized protein n=1 Tax=Polyplax serrata TaxID=468196 RepID=A0AAN8S4X4_POLSC